MSVDSGQRQFSCTITADIEGTAKLIASESALACAKSATRMPCAEEGAAIEHALRMEHIATATRLSKSVKLLLLIPLEADQSTKKSRLWWSAEARGARSASTSGASLEPWRAS